MKKNKAFLDRAEFTLKQELAVIFGLKKTISRDFPSAVRIINARKGKVVFTGIGKSGYIAMKISATFVSLGTRSVFLHPTEALHGDTGAVADGDVVIALSFSGHSAEVVRIIKHLKKEFSIKVVAITGNNKSILSKISDATIVIHVEEEGSPYGLAPMASTTASLVVGDMLASAITSPTNFKKSHFAKFHPGGSLGLELKKVEDNMTTGKDMPTIAVTDTFHNALTEMNTKGLGTVAVVGPKQKLVGVITDGDIRRALAHDVNLSKVTIENVMTKKPRHVRGQSSLKAALTLMEDNRITSLFVVGGHDTLKGILHIHDIVENNLSS